ncbi:HD-GYP domain-containing protein [Aneurinibacillus sp. Ricciae_BoGa-3]|uniref:HD-GYP domain-containing protein n=1 Tax=Aneurinibacillus sp. Ricciae_BoGa-3 TaxID=3022697 RepID=UPI00233FEB01|nr:HD-GYP domain-containing protein [Aneurinibacillus sp. Ricciae_BoGa-3]WCK54246.1 HD-GYP domain-containing protein [Aneurinibacillus sp. Ricciae_BoGa-3]
MMAIQQAFIGKRLKRDIITRDGRFLLPKNISLQHVDVKLLIKHQIFLEKEDVAHPEEAIIQDTAGQIKEIFQFAKQNYQIPLTEVERVLTPAIYELSENQDVFSILSLLQSKDDYIYKHNIGVAILSTLIGKWINLSTEQLSCLCTAALLHDIGKVGIPNHILNKPGKLTDTEFEIMKRHTHFGHELLRNTKRCEDVYSTVALQHHEREDGSGYPYHLKAQQIHPFSKIVAIADVFHAITSKRVYRDPPPFHEVINQMHAERFGKLNPHILHTFMNQIMNSLVGKSALLSDGREGIITFIHPFYPTTPIIKTGDEFVDLNTHPSVHIETVFP